MAMPHKQSLLDGILENRLDARARMRCVTNLLPLFVPSDSAQPSAVGEPMSPATPAYYSFFCWPCMRGGHRDRALWSTELCYVCVYAQAVLKYLHSAALIPLPTAFIILSRFRILCPFGPWLGNIDVVNGVGARTRYSCCGQKNG